MLYRKDKSKVFKNAFILPILQELEKTHTGSSLGEKSRHIGRQWHNEPEEVREKYHKMARLAKEEHDALYPGYKYRPKRKSKSRTTATISGGRKKRKVEEEMPIPPGIIESPSAKPEGKNEESGIKFPTEAGIITVRG
jgi:hypothetical protein